ncbi:MAG TPA: hypothetical protein VFY73_06370 [Ideonella sp.]|uniref:hypothetical protein n=1 Tax=Ideonella sp. TaxID=1929293 RepID=UPI002E32DF8F|nr:hypothetical protein [Ideonella sp.]HEX5683645.1 hypothetical protein [Ideonella sp.]
MIRVATALLLALTLVACGGSDGSTDLGDNADISVNSSGTAEVHAGESMSFVVTVANEGPAEATDVALTHHLSGPATFGSITCVSTGGASCPAALGQSMTVDSLPAGGGLVFRIGVSSAADQIGSVTSSMTAVAAADENHANDTGESTTTVLDLRNGTYTAYGSNGRQYALTLDFNRMTYRMAGLQMDKSGNFMRDADGLSYVFEGTARFRMAQDLVVGGFNFDLKDSGHVYDHGVRPFVGARVFNTDLPGLAGKSFNVLGVNLRRNDVPESAAVPSTFGDGVLRSCRAPLPIRVDQCPADFLYTYTLTVRGTEITGVDRDHGDLINFRMAQSGDLLVLLRAEDAADSTSRNFRVGLADTVGLAGGSFATSNTDSAWGTTTLTDARYAFTGTLTDGSAVSDAADLVPLSDAGPTGLRRGNRTSDAAPIYLGQNDALMLMVGAADGLAEGVMDIGLR